MKFNLIESDIQFTNKLFVKNCYMSRTIDKQESVELYEIQLPSYEYELSKIHCWISLMFLKIFNLGALHFFKEIGLSYLHKEWFGNENELRDNTFYLIFQFEKIQLRLRRPFVVPLTVKYNY